MKAAVQHGVRAVAIHADSADPRALVAAIGRAARELGGLDVLVNNGGIAPTGSIEQFRIEHFDRVFAINVRAVFVATQAAIAHMKDGGRVINIGSCNADRMPAPGAAYAMSKSALHGLVKGLARDLGPRGITINNVQPGPVDTDMNPADGPRAAATVKLLLAIPRYSRAEEIAAMVAYLAGPEAGFVTDASLTIDGGFTA